MNASQNKIWIKEFKTATLTNNKDNIKILIETFPNLGEETTGTKKEVLYYLQQSKKILGDANRQLSSSMIKIKLQQKLISTLKRKNAKPFNQYI